MISLNRFSAMVFLIFVIFSGCDQVVTNPVDKMVRVETGEQSFFIINNMSVPAYYMAYNDLKYHIYWIPWCPDTSTVQEQVLEEPENSVPPGGYKEVQFEDVFRYEQDSVFAVYVWRCENDQRAIHRYTVHTQN
ncbi:MAG: hypothetical protein GF372_12770 [Candidatus Marinimicrobia bacterium]|nr:hypothetical protein [Candidatus Neomarinimicrobiota bacterium]